VIDEKTVALARAFDRIDDFNAVQAGRTGGALRDAVIRLQGSVGIFDATRILIRDRLDEINASPGAAGHVLLGVIVGLMAAELAGDPQPVHS
jgi:hypothetical protein